ncbi:MAG: hypothetical protein M1816_002035 [Peltula sp. TS41687]|nr:MAG: hypothetical protein M1816_002035 [Peltula sp. TS41687]
MFNRQGRPAEEMFLNRPSPDPETPTVEPLRIHKRDSVSPQNTGSMSTSQSGPTDSSAKQTIPARPGASSTVNPLPYPDDEPRQQSSAQSRSPYTENARTSTAARQGTPANIPARSSPQPNPGPGSSGDYGPRSPNLAERRGNAPSSLAGRANRESRDVDGLFARPFQRPGQPGQSQSIPSEQAEAPTVNPYPDYHQQYWPPPGTRIETPPAENSVFATADSGSVNRLDSTASASTIRAQRGSPPPSRDTNYPAPAPAPGGASLSAPQPSKINRLSSISSINTTRAERGSPPPPETPIIPPGQAPGGSLDVRYAASGLSGTGYNAAAAQRAAPYAQQASRPGPSPAPQTQNPPRRPWTPTEQPGTQPYGPPTVYQGPSEVTNSPPPQNIPQNIPQTSAPPAARNPIPGQAGIEDDLQRMHLSSSPPPAYSSVGTAYQGYPNEKHAPSASTTTGAPAAAPVQSNEPPTQAQHAGHPAFANEPRPGPSPQPAQGVQTHVPQIVGPHIDPPLQTPASPPPLPEGWIAHLDQNSGQYYYIHLPTQATQWEFPKGPTPLNFEPLSPTVSTYGNHPLASPGFSAFGGKPLASPGFPSPGFPPMNPGYAESVMSMGTTSSVLTGFTGLPPSSGVDMYKIAPTNGVYFGPYLRYINMDLERGLWLGSIMLVTDAPQPPTIHIHQSVDLSPNPRQLKANPIHTHQRWVFYRYDVDLPMEGEGGAKWTYAITSLLGCTRYEFLVAGRHETGWRFIALSGNDFSMSVNANERARLGGIGFMWKDVMQKHIDTGGFHAQLGLGDQIYADRIWKEIPLLKQWLGMSGKENRKNAPWTAKHEEDVMHAYFHYYTSHFDQPHLREAFAQIPYICQLDDHDVFDGYGSYPDYMQFSHMFRNIGRIGIEMYLLFQHHATPELLRNISGDQDIFSITGTGWHFVKYLGPAVVVVGADCRSERTQHQVMAGPTYQGLFPKVATLPPSVQHCIWMLSVPLIYPRLEAAESLANTVATGKKAFTGAYNVIGKVTSSVAGVVGAKGVVGEGFNTVKRAVGKSGLMGGILSPFGEIDVLDELRDQWTHESKDLERTYLIRTLQGIAHQKSLRMTFLSGDVSCCGSGLVHDPAHPSDHKTMYQIISSSIVSAPPPSYIVKLLNTNKLLYVPQNGHRSSPAPTDTKEDMMEIFQVDVNGAPKENKKLMGRRNYVACVAYDPEVVSGAASMSNGGYNNMGALGKGTLSLAVDFMVQGDGIYNSAVKYGPVIIPHLEFGR